MSKVSIGEDEYEVADLLAYQQFILWLNEVVLGSVDGNDEELVDVVKNRIMKCQTNIDWLKCSFADLLL